MECGYDKDGDKCCFRPAVGALVVAYSSADLWSRGCVTAVQNGAFTVDLLDVGMLETVKGRDLRPLLDEFRARKVLCLSCKLSGATLLAPEAEVLAQMALTLPAGTFVDATVMGLDGDVITVDMPTLKQTLMDKGLIHDGPIDMSVFKANQL